MISKEQSSQFKKIVEEAEHITIVQAENPDGDSLGSAIALEHILSSKAEQVNLFCAVDIPKYMRYIRGWDRVSDSFPVDTDLIVIVDASAKSLLEGAHSAFDFDSVPTIIIDHHPTDEDPEATLIVNEPEYSATSQVIYDIITSLEWDINFDAAEAMLASILADTLGLASEKVDTDVLQVVTGLHLLHPDLRIATIEERRRELGKKELDIIAYKGELLQRIEYFYDNQLAIVVIPLDEIKQYSDKYNPSVLALEELRQAVGVRLAIALKVYEDRTTGKLREINNAKFCDKLASRFGGGGHPFAAGFKINETNIDSIKKQIVVEAGKLLNS